MKNTRTISKIWLLFLVFFYGLFFVLPASAADVTIPQDCWTQEQCVGQAGNETAKYFFKPGDSAFQTHCGGGSGSSSYGKCYVTPTTTTLNVPIPDLTGGSPLTTVTQFPDYLKKIYTFFVWAIAVVAVAYLGFGGYEWIVAAGSAEQIGKAKETIQGAIMGLLLALGSWVLLNTINSRLVEFDYIRVERIRPSALAHFCAEAEGTQQWIKVGDTSNEKVNAAETECNSEYFSSLNANNTCMGLKCGENSYCLPKIQTNTSASGGYECVDIDEVDDRCNEQKNPPQDCDLFDQYVQTIVKVATSSEVANQSCRFRKDVIEAGVVFIPIIEFGFLQPNECVLTQIEEAENLSFDGYTFTRIKCSEGVYNGVEVCIESGIPRTLEYWATGVPNPITSNQVEVTCSDSVRAGVGTDSICVLSNQSLCSVSQPTSISSNYLVNLYTRTDPLPDHNLPPFVWVEKSCSEFPPIGGSCQSNEKCWVLMLNYYTPEF